jgi:dCMP deaminase
MNLKEVLKEAVSKSTCRSIQLGAVIVTENGKRVLGWNGPPDKLMHEKCLREGSGIGENMHLCPAVHAERRAIYRAAKKGISVSGGTMYLSDRFPCADCAKGIIESGIVRLVLTSDVKYQKGTCYNFEMAEKLLNSARVKIEVNKSLKP